MEQSAMQLQAKLMKEYYKDFSKYAKGRRPEGKVAWVTAFTPVEILEALGISYYYPESYAAVIAASGKEKEFLEESGRCSLSLDCCSYSCCFEGSLEREEGPRGIPPKPDVLIATNNQCNTLPNWWNILARRYGVPLIILDYPGESADKEAAYGYVAEQHQHFISQMENLSANKLDMEVLERLIMNSKRSVESWNSLVAYLPRRILEPTVLFDAISFLITSRCKSQTAELYALMRQEFEALPEADASLLPLFWLGYPLWYHPNRYLKEVLDGCKIVGSNYITWWSLDYGGEDVMEQLFHAYNYTFLNLTQKTKDKRLAEGIRKSGAVGAITMHNKSCKCDFVSARNVGIPQAELEIDMIDRGFLDVAKARRQVELLKEGICTI